MAFPQYQTSFGTGTFGYEASMRRAATAERPSDSTAVLGAQKADGYSRSDMYGHPTSPISYGYGYSHYPVMMVPPPVVEPPLHEGFHFHPAEIHRSNEALSLSIYIHILYIYNIHAVYDGVKYNERPSS